MNHECFGYGPVRSGQSDGALKALSLAVSLTALSRIILIATSEATWLRTGLFPRDWLVNYGGATTEDISRTRISNRAMRRRPHLATDGGGAPRTRHWLELELWSTGARPAVAANNPFH